MRGELNASRAIAAPALCAHSTVASLVSPCLAANITMSVIMASFMGENSFALARVRTVYAALVPVSEVFINRTLSQRTNVIAAIDTAMAHFSTATLHLHLVVLRFDMYLKLSLAPHVLPFVRTHVPRVLVAFPSRQIWTPGRLNGSRPGCLHHCRPPTTCASIVCKNCGVFPGEGNCSRPLPSAPFENGINDVLFGFFALGAAFSIGRQRDIQPHGEQSAPTTTAATASLLVTMQNASASSGMVWWRDVYRTVFAASPRPGDLHGVGAALSRHACIAYILPDAFNTNTEHSANPLYDILPRSHERVEKGDCVQPSQFQQFWAGAPPCCPIRGRKYCPQSQGLPAPAIRTCKSHHSLATRWT